ncbi:MAG: VacJ family lipoprotein [Gammaproteobacteria bacterium]|nr:VacJ family lipoprotein [Gammaproteobacteria bacterium]
MANLLSFLYLNFRTDKLIGPAILLLMLTLQTGCITATNPDPLEPINRPIQSFNNMADRVLVRPLAQAYQIITPELAEQAVIRMFRNLAELTNASNQLLQGKPQMALNDLARFLVNSTLGLGGLFDPATELGLQPHLEDFGQTLGVWGIPQGPYLVLPFRGPATLRNLVGGFSDQFTLLPLEIGHVPTRNNLFLFQIVSLRSQAPMRFPDGIDPYLLLRDGFLRRQQGLLSDQINPFTSQLPIGLLNQPASRQ